MLFRSVPRLVIQTTRETTLRLPSLSRNMSTAKQSNGLLPMAEGSEPIFEEVAMSTVVKVVANFPDFFKAELGFDLFAGRVDMHYGATAMDFLVSAMCDALPVFETESALVHRAFTRGVVPCLPGSNDKALAGLCYPVDEPLLLNRNLKSLMIGRVGSEKRLCVVYSHADPVVDASLEILSAYEVYSYFCKLFWPPINDLSHEATSTSPEPEEEPAPLTTEEMVEQSTALDIPPIPAAPLTDTVLFGITETPSDVKVKKPVLAPQKVEDKRAPAARPPSCGQNETEELVEQSPALDADVPVFCPLQETSPPRVPARMSRSAIPSIPVVPPTDKTALFETSETSSDVKVVKEKKPVSTPQKVEAKRGPAARPPPRGQNGKGGPSGKTTSTQRPQGSREVNQSKVDSAAVSRQRSFVKRPKPSPQG